MPDAEIRTSPDSEYLQFTYGESGDVFQYLEDILRGEEGIWLIDLFAPDQDCDEASLQTCLDSPLFWGRCHVTEPGISHRIK